MRMCMYMTTAPACKAVLPVAGRIAVPHRHALTCMCRSRICSAASGGKCLEATSCSNLVQDGLETGASTPVNLTPRQGGRHGGALWLEVSRPCSMPTLVIGRMQQPKQQRRVPHATLRPSDIDACNPCWTMLSSCRLPALVLCRLELWRWRLQTLWWPHEV